MSKNPLTPKETTVLPLGSCGVGLRSIYFVLFITKLKLNTGYKILRCNRPWGGGFCFIYGDFQTNFGR